MMSDPWRSFLVIFVTIVTLKPKDYEKKLFVHARFRAIYVF